MKTIGTRSSTLVYVSERQLKPSIGSNQYITRLQSSRLKKIRERGSHWYSSRWTTLFVLPFMLLPVVNNVMIASAQEVKIISPLASEAPTVMPTPSVEGHAVTLKPPEITLSSKPSSQPEASQPQQKEIKNYIIEVFGKDSDKAFKLLSCENSSMDPDAVNTYGNYPKGSRDIGVFMINEYWQEVKAKFLFNPKINIEIAYQLFKENGNSFKLWTCGRKLKI